MDAFNPPLWSPEGLAIRFPSLPRRAGLRLAFRVPFGPIPCRGGELLFTSDATFAMVVPYKPAVANPSRARGTSVKCDDDDDANEERRSNAPDGLRDLDGRKKPPPRDLDAISVVLNSAMAFEPKQLRRQSAASAGHTSSLPSRHNCHHRYNHRYNLKHRFIFNAGWKFRRGNGGESRAANSLRETADQLRETADATVAPGTKAKRDCGKTEATPVPGQLPGTTPGTAVLTESEESYSRP